MGAFQLPDSVYGAAIGCLTYSFTCLFANIILVWLIWVHRERTSYVAFISYFTLLATVTSLVQQLYDYILWVDIMTWQFWYGIGKAYDAEVQYQNEIFGLKLGLSYVRQFCFIIESSLVFFFSLALAATVYGWWAKSGTALRKLSIIGRVLPVILGVISIVLLQLEFAHNSFTAYMAIANAQFLLSLLGASVFLLMILYKYVQTRRRLKTWLRLDYGQHGQAHSTTTSSVMKKGTLKARRSRAYSGSQQSATFDNWLVIRLSIAFVMLCVFEYTNISPRFRNREKILATLHETAPDLSHKRAMATVKGYISGVTPSLLAFLVFGTTKAFQRKMSSTFLPACLRRRRKEDDYLTSIYHLPMTSSVNSSYNRASTALYPQSPHTPATKGYHFRTSSMRMPEPVVFTPGGPNIPLKTYKSESSLNSSRYDPNTTSTETGLLHPPPLAATATGPGNRVLSPIREPRWEDWLDEGQDSDTISLRRSQIGLAISEPSSPAMGSVAPWDEPLSINAAAAIAAAASPSSIGRRPSFFSPSRRGPTFLRDSPDEYSSSDEMSASPPLVSLPVSRFNNTKTAAEPQEYNTTTGGRVAVSVVTGFGHKRQTSDTSQTGSITMIWSDGPAEQSSPLSPSAAARSLSRMRSARSRDRSASSAARPGPSSTRPGVRDYSTYVAPTARRGSAA